MRTTDKRIGFTLVELLVVMAIISVMAGMLLPALQKARQSARGSACTSNLSQFGKAVTLYGMDVPAEQYHYPLWLTGLYKSEMGRSAMPYVCPNDPSRGAEGGRPDIFSNLLGVQPFAETNDGTAVFTTPDGNPPRPTWVHDDTAYDLTTLGGNAQGSSYLYEWTREKASWFNDSMMSNYPGLTYDLPIAGYGSEPGVSWYRLKKSEDSGNVDACGHYAAIHTGTYCPDMVKVRRHTVPLIRCFWHIRQVTDLLPFQYENSVLNLRFNGNVDKSPVDGWWIQR